MAITGNNNDDLSLTTKLKVHQLIGEYGTGWQGTYGAVSFVAKKPDKNLLEG